MNKYIGIDLGTSSIKLSLVNTKGIIEKEVSGEYPLFTKGSYSEQNPKDWFKTFEICLDKLLAKTNPKEVKGFSFSGQMHGLVILDKNDKVLRPCILWNDTRSVEETNYLNNKISKSLLNKLTGNIAYAGFTAPKLLWVKNNEPAIFKKIAKIMLPKDYLAYMLTGNFTTDYSDAAGTLYLDVKNKVWSKQMLNILGISERQLPRLYESYEYIGKVKEAFAKKHKLEDVKVFIGAGDNAASAIGMGVTSQDCVNISLGTSGTILIPLDRFIEAKNNALHAFNHANGKWCYLGCILSAASCRKWFIQKVLNDDYDKIDKLTANVNADGLYFLPYLSGERSPHNDTNIRGAFIGLNHNTDRAVMNKALMEGVAFALRDCLEVARANNINPKYATICGGGAKSNEWIKIIANVMNLSVYKSNGSGSYGAALLAMIGNKEFKDFKELNSKLIKHTNPVKPITKLVKYYEDKYKVFKKLYPALKNIKL